MASHHSGPASQTAERPSPGITAARPHVHLPRRHFIGPLPVSLLTSERAQREKDLRARVVASAREAQAIWAEESDSDDDGQGTHKPRLRRHGGRADAGLVRGGDGGKRDWLKGKALEGHERRRARRAAAMNNILLAGEEPSTPPHRWSIFPFGSTRKTSVSADKAAWSGGSFLIGGDLHEMHAARKRQGVDPEVYPTIGKDGEVRAGKTGDETTREGGGAPTGEWQREEHESEVDEQEPKRNRLDIPHRPSYAGSRSTGMQSFTTARTHLNASTEALDESEDSGGRTPRPFAGNATVITASPPSLDTSPNIPLADLHADTPAPLPGHASIRTSASDAPQDRAYTHEASSSRKHLLTQNGDARPPLTDHATAPAVTSGKSRQGKGVLIPERLKSAMKRSGSRQTDGGALAGTAGSVGHADAKSTRKRGKSVQFPKHAAQKHSPPASRQSPGSASPATAPGDLEPANPREVLARSGDDVAGTSAGAAQEAKREKEEQEEAEAAEVLPGHVIMKDRMLVRVCHSRNPGLMAYDEEIERRKPCARVARFEEYLVVYRQGKIELYSEWKVPYKDRFLQTKRLCYTIPLQKGRTNLSIYTHADLTMCLSVDLSTVKADLEGRHGETMRDRAKRKLKDTKQYKWLKRDGEGTEIFMLLHKERDRATDWCWEMWRELGGELPTSLDIQVPALKMTVRLPIPAGDYVGDTSQFGSMSRQSVIEACEEALNAVPAYKRIRQQRELETGEKIELALAWQTNGRLDWLTSQQDRDVAGKTRYWTVLGGLSTMPARDVSQLEIRPVHHLPTGVRLTDGKSLDQPPDVEGFLSRVDDAGAIDVYLFSYAGNIFSAPVKGVLPPFPLDNPFDELPSGEVGDALVELHLRRERDRAFRNMRRTSGYLDFRDIERLNTLPPDKDGKKDARFKVTLRTGEELVMEAHNAAVRDEWVERLLQLQKFWITSQRVQARQKMEAMGNLTRTENSQIEAIQSEDPAYRPQLYNWCALEQCSPILHAGRLFVKRSKTRQFRSSYCVLSKGTLMQYKIRRATAYHHIQQKYSLQQAYIYSGLLAQKEITSITREDPFQGEARVYQDGLECADGAEDCTFVLWIRGKDRHLETGSKGKTEISPVPLSKEPKRMLVFRARSRLERDVWLWAIQLEIERQAHGDPDRVIRERTSGLVPEKN